MNFVAWQNLDVLPSDRLDLSTAFLNCWDSDYNILKYKAGSSAPTMLYPPSLLPLCCSISLFCTGVAGVETPEDSLKSTL